jgi:hypothetical protein
METIILSDAEYQILSILNKHKSFKKANNDLYRAFEVSVLWKNIYSLRDKKYIDLIIEPGTNKVKEVIINKEFNEIIKNVEIREVDEVKSGTQVADFSKDTIRFHMQKLKQDSIFSTQFGGIISFPRQVVLEANKKYIYAVFKRENDDMLFTLTPEDKIIQSAQHFDLEDHPTHIRKIIRDFLNAIKNKKRDFESF